jgi:RNA polymerase sigma-70 factor, ECF subfamily
MHTAPDGSQSDASADDVAVIAHVLEGHTQQFALLVKRHQAALYRHAVCLVFDHDVAADMVQDAFVRAYTRLGTCRDHTRFRAWLFRALHNRCLDYLKDARRRNVPLEDAGPMVDPAERPDARVERARLRDGVVQALARLPESQREAFLMHHVEGMPYDAMAELLKVSVSALKMRVLRAREALASALQADEVRRAVPARLAVERG